MHASVLKYFSEVARCGSIRKAAQRLFVAPSAINRQIRNLEDELGVELFDRLPTGLKLTAAGERLLQHVRGTLEDFHAMRSELDALKGARTGHISIVAMDSALEKLVPSAVEDFGGSFPAVTYSIQYASISKVPDMVASGEFDIGICFCQKAPPGTRVVASARFPSGVVLGISHPLAKKEELTFEECRAYSIFRPGSDHELPTALSAEHVRHWEQAKVQVQSNSFGLLKSLIMGGHGLVFFTKLGFLSELEQNAVVWRPLVGVSETTPDVVILVQSQKTLSPVGDEFLKCLIRIFKQFEAATKNGL
jgi:DNA-binding transcriptional LysR family regulator